MQLEYQKGTMFSPFFACHSVELSHVFITPLWSKLQGKQSNVENTRRSYFVDSQPFFPFPSHFEPIKYFSCSLGHIKLKSLSFCKCEKVDFYILHTHKNFSFSSMSLTVSVNASVLLLISLQFSLDYAKIILQH